MSSKASEACFVGVHFHIVKSKTLNQDDVDQLTDILLKGGAELEKSTNLENSGRLPLPAITHIISDTIDFPDYDDAVDTLKAVVKPQWVHASAAKNKLASPKQYSPDPRQFFSGLIVCCADLPSGDSDAIIGGVIAMGGLYSSAVTRQVTHIVALTVEAEKCQAALAKSLKCKIVLPHWFDDCLKLGRRIDEKPYCLPDPEILRKDGSEKVQEVNRADMHSASTPQPAPLSLSPEDPNSQVRSLTIFQSKKVMLSADLDISSHLRGVIEDLVVAGGGAVTGSVRKADYFICHYRESLEYRIASRAGKDVGNLSWLYHLIMTNHWTSPMRRLLHYPISKAGLPGFKRFRISLSNYNGEARIYLENLATAAGSDFTKTMKEDNTHLITAHTASEKCDAAKEWNINMINHLWLEESYAKWQVQSLANPRYTQFPSRTNLGEVVGQTAIDRQAVERFFFPSGSDIEEATEVSLQPKSTAAKDHTPLSDKPSKVNAQLNSPALGMPFRSSDGSTPKASKAHLRHMDLSTPAHSRLGAQGKENETPSTTSSRGAKERAIAKLHDLTDDIALFEKERKRVGGVTHGGKRDSADLAQNGNPKRSISNDHEDSASAEDDTKGAKRSKKTKGLPSPAIRLALSGYKRWVGQQSRKEMDEKARLRDLGILIVQDHSSCTHLAAPRIIRTQKFICALAHAPVVVSTDFLDQCLDENILLDPNRFLLKDNDYEKQWDYRFKDALARAKKNKGRLFKGFSIYCTETVHGGYETYKAIIEANGGKCVLYKARAITNPVLRGNENDDPQSEPEEHQNIFLLSGVTREEAKLWPRFRSMVEAAGQKPVIVRTDWALNTALAQEMARTSSFSLTEDDIRDD